MTARAVVEMSSVLRRASPAGKGHNERRRKAGAMVFGQTTERVGCRSEVCMNPPISLIVFGSDLVTEAYC